MTATLLLALLLAVATLSGATASVAGFGIGSILTPVLAARVGMSVAVAAVSIPHAIATGLRFWRLRSQVDWRVVRTFGVLSAVGGLAGALLYARIGSRSLTIVLGLLLLATSASALSDWMRRWQPSGAIAQLFGLASGFFGGVAGNQGGLRTAALLTFRLSPATLVATSTAVGLAVDAARMPIYVWRANAALRSVAIPIAVATAGVVLGTIIGERVLLGLSPQQFRRIVGILIGALGLWLVFQ